MSTSAGMLASASSATTAPPGKRGDPRAPAWRILSQPRFAGYFAGSLASNLGTWLQNTAQMLLAYKLTHSALDVGVVTCAQFSGFLLLGPWAGTIAGYLGGKRVLVGAQLASAVLAAGMAYLTFTGALTERVLVIGALAIGLAFTFSLPLQTAMVPGLLEPSATPDSDTKAAMAMNSVSYNSGRALAPVLAVVVLANVGAAWAFTLNAISFVVLAATVLAVYPRVLALPVAGSHPDRNALRVAVEHPRILLMLTMVASVTLADDPVLVLGPTLAHQVLAVSGNWPAYFLSALGLGTVLGALIPTRAPSSHRAAVPLLMLAVSVLVFTSGISVWTSWLAAVTTGVAALLTGSCAQALILKAAPKPEQAAQVMALWAVAWAGTKPLASLADGWLAVNFGVFPAGLVLAGPALIVAALELWLPGRLRGKAKDIAKAYRERQAAARWPS